MTKTERQKQILKKREQQERLDKVRQRRWSKNGANSVLLEAKLILGLIVFNN